MDKKTLILGASPNPDRYAFLAAERLRGQNIEFLPVGIKKGEVLGQSIINNRETPQEDIHTITLYIGPQHQKEWYDYILALAPKRLIFNPGTENPELFALAQSNGIEVMNACTLVMLGNRLY